MFILFSESNHVRLSLSQRIIAIIGAVTISVILAISVPAILSGMATTEKESLLLLQSTSRNAAQTVQADLISAMESAEHVAAAFESLKQQGIEDRRVYDGLLRQYAEMNAHHLGVWSVWEPNALDGQDNLFANHPNSDATGRYITSWVRDQGQLYQEALLGYDKPNSYYQQMLSRQKPTFHEPFTYIIHDKKHFMTTISFPIYHQDKIVGAAGIDISLAYLAAHLEEIKPFQDGYVSLLSQGGLVVVDPDAGKVGKSLTEIGLDQAISTKLKTYLAQHEAGIVETQDPKSKKGQIKVTSSVPLGESQQNWAIIATAYQASVFKDVNELVWQLIGIAVVMALLTVGISFLVGRQISRPVLLLAQSLKQLMQGRTDQILSFKRHDEIGEMAEAYEALRLAMIEKEELQHQQQMQKQQIEDERKQILTSLAADFQTQIGSLMGSVNLSADEMAQLAANMDQATSGAARQVTGVASHSTQVSDSISHIQGTCEALSHNITDISHQVSQGTDVTSEAVSHIKSVSERVGDLSKTVLHIDEVVTLINQIANQTNLLALNATIEAARAGESGKGFAVVASEVKNLASQTGKATEDIAAQVHSIQTETEQTVASIQAVEKRITEIDQLLDDIAAHINQQDQAATEITHHVVQAAQGAQATAQDITDIAEVMQIVGTQSHQVLSSAQGVQGTSVSLKEDVGTFLGQIKAG